MDWIDRLNQALAYIEKNLHGEISHEEISRITVCPIALFQRFFMLATGITLSEYIRRRKLSRAAVDLRENNTKVIDVAVRYGYESPDAFSVAFKRLYGMTPSQARRSGSVLKRYDRIYFTLTITHIRGDKDMVLLNIDKYRYYGPLFEGTRIILSFMGEKYTPEYIQGISGAAFKIAGGCPSRPTCVCDRWTPDFIRYLGFEIKESPCFDENGNDVSETMIEAVKHHIDGGKPALVWNAFTNLEWDVVCGYDEETKQFIGRGTHKGWDDYHREPWDRAKSCDISFGAVLIGDRLTAFDEREAEIHSLANAVRHARKETEAGDEGIQFYRKWAAMYAAESADRGVADAYCYDTYSSVRKAAVVYLREISYKFGSQSLEYLQKAANCFEQEAKKLADAYPYLSWESPWGVDEERSGHLAPLLRDAAEWYEKGMEWLEKTLSYLHIEY